MPKKNIIGILGIYYDITEQKEAEAQLLRERDFSERLIETAQAIILILDPQGKILQFNPYMEELTGYTSKEVEGKEWFATFIPEPQREATRKLFHKAFSDVPTQGNISMLSTKQGDILQVEWHDKTLKNEAGETVGLLAVGMDVTGRIEAEKELKLLHCLINHSGDAIEIIDPKTLQFLSVNETECRELGYSREELLNMTVYDIDPTYTRQHHEINMETMRRKGSTSCEGMHRRKNGTAFPVEVRMTLVELDKPYLLAIASDITERKRSEAALLDANRALRALSEGNQLLIRAECEKELLHEVTKIFTTTGGYSLAAVYYTEENHPKGFVPVVWSRSDGCTCTPEHPLCASSEKAEELITQAILNGKTQICHDVANGRQNQLRTETAPACGIVSNIALPLHEGDRTFGVLGIYSSRSDVFNDAEVELLKEMADDLAYGIVNLRAHAEHEHRAKLLRQSLEQSVQAIASTVEARDPYTAGHQRRVAELATAIAREMGLGEEQVSSIHLAAIIHDLGKIHIPAEILAKPRKLTELEYKMIQLHPQAGYDIIKNIVFPWPIAEIILQHHEKLDGSGYPQGLSGNAILLEARILSVADVVEAMSSHRPYRPSLGTEAALKEIRNGSGKSYDTDVVNACLALFKHREFAFSDSA